MPNPLLNSRMNLGKRAQERLNPVPEHIEDEHDMNAWRGIDVHGVPDQNDASPTEPYDATVMVHYPPVPEDVTPVPVRVVTEGNHEMRDFRVIREIVSTPARMVINRDRSRTSLAIANYGTVNVWIGDGSGANASNGYRIAPGVELALNAQAEVWIASDDGSAQPIGILIERVVKGGFPA